MHNLVGYQMGRYLLRQSIGWGSTGAVYRALDRSLGREVAIKVLHPTLTGDPSARQRFLNEAQVAAQLHHPNIVTTLDYGEQNGLCFLVMEYLPGRSLGALLQKEPALAPDKAAQVAIQVASALDYAHGRGLVHRDIKPDNIIVRPDGHATLTDFGIVRVATSPGGTQVGRMVGTPAYMAPEQIMGGDVTAATDTYALGIVCYQMLAGRAPFLGETAALLHAHVYTPPPPLRRANPRLSAELEAVVHQALAKFPTQRWISAGAFALALARAVAALPASARTRKPRVPRLPVSGAPLGVRRRTALAAMLGALALLTVGALVWLAVTQARAARSARPVYPAPPTASIRAATALSQSGRSVVPPTATTAHTPAPRPTQPPQPSLTPTRAHRPSPTPAPQIARSPTPRPPTPTAACRAAARGLIGFSRQNRAGASSGRGSGPVEVWVMDADGSGQARMCNPQAYTWGLQRDKASADGRWRVEVSAQRKDIVRIYTGGQWEWLIVNNLDDWDPVLSADSWWLAWVTNRNGNDEIYIKTMDPKDQNQLRLTANGWEWDKHPSWSPDGRQIAFYSNRASTLGAATCQIWTMEVVGGRGTNLRNLSNRADKVDTNPVWFKWDDLP